MDLSSLPLFFKPEVVLNKCIKPILNLLILLAALLCHSTITLSTMEEQNSTASVQPTPAPLYVAESLTDEERSVYDKFLILNIINACLGWFLGLTGIVLGLFRSNRAFLMMKY